MRTRIFSALLAVVFTVIGSGGLRAEFNVQQIQTQFNSMNSSNPNNQGYDFLYYSQVAGNSLQASSGTVRPNMSNYNTYASDRSSYFRSFCVNPTLTVSNGQRYYGNLNIQADGTTRTVDNAVLSVGAAFLYKTYATQLPTDAAPYNIFSDLHLENRSAQFEQALHYLMGLSGAPDTIWNENVYLQFLTQQYPGKTRDYWTRDYSATQYYGEIGDYFVYVMNVNVRNANGTTGAAGQDFLYLASATWTTSGVPEPATLLFWTLGGLGLACTSRTRSRRMKKLALA